LSCGKIPTIGIKFKGFHVEILRFGAVQPDAVLCVGGDVVSLKVRNAFFGFGYFERSGDNRLNLVENPTPCNAGILDLLAQRPGKTAPSEIEGLRQSRQPSAEPEGFLLG
jgi:hypothetical protein